MDQCENSPCVGWLPVCSHSIESPDGRCESCGGYRLPAPSTLPAETREGREALAQQIEAALADVPRGHGSEYDAGRAVGLRRALRIVRAASPAVSLPGEEKKP